MSNFSHTPRRGRRAPDVVAEVRALSTGDASPIASVPTSVSTGERRRLITLGLLGRAFGRVAYFAETDLTDPAFEVTVNGILIEVSDARSYDAGLSVSTRAGIGEEDGTFVSLVANDDQGVVAAIRRLAAEYGTTQP